MTDNLNIVGRSPVCLSALGEDQAAHLPRGQPWPDCSEWLGIPSITRDPDVHILLQRKKIGMLELIIVAIPALESVSFIPEQQCSATVN